MELCWEQIFQSTKDLNEEDKKGESFKIILWFQADGLPTSIMKTRKRKSTWKQVEI